MAQLKDLLVNGATRLIGDVFTNKIQITSISAPTSAGGSTYNTGTNGQVLKSNGTSVYWTTLGTMASAAAGDYVLKSGDTMTGKLTVVGNGSSAFNDYGIHFTNNSRIGENSSGGLGIYAPDKVYIRPGSSTTASSYGLEVTTTGITVGSSDIIFTTGSNASTANGVSFKNGSTMVGHMGMDNASTSVLGIYSKNDIAIRPGSGSIATTDGFTISTTAITPKKDAIMNIGTSSYKFANIYGTLKGNADTATSANYLAYQSQLTTVDAVNNFNNTITGIQAAKMSALAFNDSGSLGNNDGIIISIPWNASYGHQIYIDDASLQLHHRFRSPTDGTPTWKAWRKILDSTNYTDYTVTKTGTGASGTWGISISGNATSATTATNATNIYSSASTSKAYVLGTTTASSANHATVYNASVYTSGSVLFGAAWNDYAEYRITKDEIEAGRCVVETGHDDLILSSERLQPGAEIVSDTFGFAIGETEDAKTPIATTGRALAYIFEGRAAAQAAIGRPVCSGPNGTVSIMTDEEYQKYGYCAIGTISAVPDYEEWGEDNIKVNGRVWIRIR